MIPATTNFSNANASLVKTPWHILQIAGYSPIFTFGKTGIVGQYPWISKMSPLTQKVNDTEGTSTLSDLSIEIIDKNQQITSAFPTFTFEGKQATVTSGFPTITYPTDFLTVATLVIDKVSATADNTVWVFTLKDQSRLTKGTVVYTTGDDGFRTSNDHPKSLFMNPMDVLTDVLQNQLGLPAAQINSSEIARLKAGIFAGMQMKFRLTTAPNAKDWIDRELFKALGGYSFSNYAGAITPVYFVPNKAPVSAITLTDHNLVKLPTPDQAEVLNFVTYRLDASEKKSSSTTSATGFMSELTEVYGTSVTLLGKLQTQHVLESHGLESGKGGWQYARLLVNTLFLRYGLKPMLLNVEAFWTAVIVEPGDFVRVTHSLIPNRTTGTLGITNRLFEVLEVKKNFDKGTIELLLLDMNWLDQLTAVQVAPDGEPAWPLSTRADRLNFMFISNSAGVHSDGSAGQAIF